MIAAKVDSLDLSRVHSPRPETPEPNSRQGRRNEGVQLLDDEGAISEKFEQCLLHIFAKYCTPQPTPDLSSPGTRNSTLLVPLRDACLTPADLDRWAQDTNGAPFTEEAKDELKEFLDVNDDGNLTLNGFMQIYQLQTENDEEETWRDLSNHGFDRTLTLVATRREHIDAEESNTPLSVDLNSAMISKVISTA